MPNGGAITAVVPGIGISGGGQGGEVEVSLNPTASVTFSGLTLARQNDPPNSARTIQIPNCRWVMREMDERGGGTGGGIPEPPTAGNFLRTGAGTWQPLDRINGGVF